MPPPTGGAGGVDAGDRKPAPDVAKKRGNRLICQWGPFKINELAKVDRATGEVTRIGLSIICGRHSDTDGDANACSSDCNFGSAGLAEADVMLRLKRWAVRGFGADDEVCPRLHHMKILGPARKHTKPCSEDELAKIPAGLFSEGELAGL